MGDLEILQNLLSKDGCVVVVENFKSAEFGSLGLASFGAGMHAVVYSCLVCSSWTEELFALNDKDRDK